MKNKMLSLMLILALLLCQTAALAEVPKLADDMFKYAKGALNAMSSGAYDKLVTALPCSDVSPSANEWEKFAKGSFSDLSSPQTTYAVAYWTGSVWRIAVPISEPSSGSVETFVLISEDGSSFSGYASAKWSSIDKDLSKASHVVWNKEYVASTSAVVEADS